MKSAKIIKIGLNNYKVFEKLDINLSNCNVFVGPNSSGKSSIGEILIFFRETMRLFSRKSSQTNYNSLINFLNKAFRIGQNKPFNFMIEVEIDDLLYFYDVEFFTRHDTDAVWANERFTIQELQNNDILFKASMEISDYNFPNLKARMIYDTEGFSVPKDHSGAITYFSSSILDIENIKSLNNKNQIEKIMKFYDFWDQIRFYDFNVYNKQKITAKSSISTEMVLSEDFQNLLKVLINLNFQKKNIFKEIKTWLKKLLPDLKDITMQTSLEKSEAFLTFSEKNWDVYLPLENASDGMVRLICLLTILFNKEQTTLLILDEPENGLHPAIRKYIADFSRTVSDEIQIVILTHDSETLREYELDMIYYFKRKKGSTEVKRLSDERALVETIKALKDIDKNTVVSTHLTDSL